MASWFRLRPTFQIGLAESCDEARNKLERLFAREADNPLRMLHGEYGELHLPPNQHRLWSPDHEVHEHWHSQWHTHVVVHEATTHAWGCLRALA